MAVAEIRNRPQAFIGGQLGNENTRFPRVKSGASTLVQFVQDRRQIWRDASVVKKTKIAAALSIPFILGAAGCSAGTAASGENHSSTASASSAPSPSESPSSSGRAIAPDARLQSAATLLTYQVAEIGQTIRVGPLTKANLITTNESIPVHYTNGAVVEEFRDEIVVPNKRGFVRTAVAQPLQEIINAERTTNLKRPLILDGKVIDMQGYPVFVLNEVDIMPSTPATNGVSTVAKIRPAQIEGWRGSQYRKKDALYNKKNRRPQR